MPSMEEALYGGEIPQSVKDGLSEIKDPAQKQLFLCFEWMKMANERICKLEKKVKKLRKKKRGGANATTPTSPKTEQAG